MPQTPNHGYNVPNKGDANWHQPLNANFKQYDTDIELRDTDANKSNYTPKQGAKFLATDTGIVYEGDGSNWNATLAQSRYSAPSSSGAAGNLVAGHPNNNVGSGVSAATIAGGGTNSDPNEVTADGGAVGGGRGNSVTGKLSVAAGGKLNLASGSWSAVAGGDSNGARGKLAFVGGGSANLATGAASCVGGGRGNRATALDTTVAGGFGNTASASGAAVGGGEKNDASGDYGTVAGGRSNTASGKDATIGGGNGNTASLTNSTVGGGASNTAKDANGTIGGGANNTVSGASGTIAGGASNSVTVALATICGGRDNVASGGNAMVVGGEDNEASGEYAFAAGHKATAAGDGTFVWGDSSTNGVTASQTDEFKVQAGGGAVIFSASDHSAGVNLKPGSGSWSAWSSRAAKSNVEAVVPGAALDGVRSLEIATWNYDGQDESIRHMGPMAEQFYDEFGLGGDRERIANVDADGVAFAAIQALAAALDERDEQLEEQQATIDDQQERIDELEAENAALRERVDAIEQRIDRLAPDAVGPATADD